MLDKTHFSLLIVIISPDFFRPAGLFLRLTSGDGQGDKRKQGERNGGETGLLMEMNHILFSFI